jgi:hypothetical protein
VLTVILGVVTAFTAAPSARWLLSYEGAVPVRPPVIIARLALLQWLPLVLGAWAASRLSARRVASVTKVVHFTLIAGLIGLLVAAIPRFDELMSDLGWMGLFAAIVTMEVAVILAWVLAGKDRQLAHSLAATVSLPNIGLAVMIAKVAGARPVLISTLAALFLVRVLANQLLIFALARSAKLPAGAGGPPWTTTSATGRPAPSS